MFGIFIILNLFLGQKLKDADLAKYEEEEAMQIQKRFLNSISEHDLGMDLLFRNDVDQKSSVKTSAKEKQDNEQLMSKSKKIDIIKQESPELNLLINDFNKYSNEIVNELHPLLDGLEKNNASSSSGLKYLKLRFRILYYYCTNISFYMSLKCSPDRQFIKEHPIIKNLFTFKKLICELDSCLQQNEKFLNELKFARNLIAKNAKLKFTETQISEIKFDSDLINKDFDALDQEEILSENNEENDLDKDEKRAITYEMEKNKGLTPKRKRENRNPRVKYRRKFHKAVIRRKGQVREPRKELQKYGGEVTGINVHAVKSVKFN